MEVCDSEYFLITELFVKTWEMSVKKVTFFLCPAFAIFCRNILGFFKNRSRRTRVDKHDLKLKKYSQGDKYKGGKLEIS